MTSLYAMVPLFKNWVVRVVNMYSRMINLLFIFKSSIKSIWIAKIRNVGIEEVITLLPNNFCRNKGFFKAL
jgi:hypothetical protein